MDYQVWDRKYMGIIPLTCRLGENLMDACSMQSKFIAFSDPIADTDYIPTHFDIYPPPQGSIENIRYGLKCSP